VIKKVGVLLLVVIVLSAFGSQSEATAMKNWISQSNFKENVAQVAVDAKKAVRDLQNASLTKLDLDTICGVLLLETDQVNASLPTPDNQSTSLLSKSYTNVGGGANECYKAGKNKKLRVKALSYLRNGLAELSEAMLRVEVASGTYKG
jgi:hypothetical protein